MGLIAASNGTCNHTGSVCSGSVAGTLTAGSNSFYKIEGQNAMVQNGTLVVPTHNNPPCSPPNNLAHSFVPNILADAYFYIEGNKAVLVGDAYTTDATTVNGAGSNTFVTVT